jgi:hypothetical protein
VILAAVVAAVGLVALLVLVSLPIAQESSGDRLGDGRPYSFVSEARFGNSSWRNSSYRGVTFGFHL